MTHSHVCTGQEIYGGDMKCLHRLREILQLNRYIILYNCTYIILYNRWVCMCMCKHNYIKIIIIIIIIWVRYSIYLYTHISLLRMHCTPIWTYIKIVRILYYIIEECVCAAALTGLTVAGKKRQSRQLETSSQENCAWHKGFYPSWNATSFFLFLTLTSTHMCILSGTTHCTGLTFAKN